MLSCLGRLSNRQYNNNITAVVKNLVPVLCFCKKNPAPLAVTRDR